MRRWSKRVTPKAYTALSMDARVGDGVDVTELTSPALEKATGHRSSLLVQLKV